MLPTRPTQGTIKPAHFSNSSSFTMAKSQGKEAVRKRRQRAEIAKDPAKCKKALQKDSARKRHQRAERAKDIASNPEKYEDTLELEKALNRERVRRSHAKNKAQTTPREYGQHCWRQTEGHMRR